MSTFLFSSPALAIRCYECVPVPGEVCIQPKTVVNCDEKPNAAVTKYDACSKTSYEYSYEDIEFEWSLGLALGCAVKVRDCGLR